MRFAQGFLGVLNFAIRTNRHRQDYRETELLCLYAVAGYHDDRAMRPLLDVMCRCVQKRHCRQLFQLDCLFQTLMQYHHSWFVRSFRRFLFEGSMHTGRFWSRPAFARITKPCSSNVYMTFVVQAISTHCSSLIRHTPQTTHRPGIFASGVRCCAVQPMRTLTYNWHKSDIANSTASIRPRVAR